jgi:hypothetical protein
MQFGRFGRAASVALALTSSAGAASASTVPFTEDFANAAGWTNANNAAVTAVGSGGPDGGSYVSTSFDYFGFTSPFGGGPVIFRGQDENNASGLGLVGDWIAGGVDQVSIWVRQNTTETLTYFLRVASTFNFPGAVVNSTTLVAPNTWTLVTFDIDPSSALCFPEGTTCAAALADVDHVQFGTNAPAALTTLDQAFTLDLDKVSIRAVPEPTTLLLLASGLAALASQSRRRTA